MKIVKVARVGKRVVEVALDDNATVDQALTGGRVRPLIGEVIYVNHVPRPLSFVPCNGTSIVLEKPKTSIVSRSTRLESKRDRIADLIGNNTGVDIDLDDDMDLEMIDDVIRIAREG